MTALLEKPRIDAGSPYRLGERRDCPCCGWPQWYVGSNVAQCVRCAMPLPICHSSRSADRFRKLHFSN